MSGPPVASQSVLRVVLVTTVVPYDEVPHAGGRYLLALVRLLEAETDLTVIASGSRTNREAAARPGAPRTVLLLGLEPGRTLRDRAVNYLSLHADRRLRRLDPGMPYLPLRAALATSAEVRTALRSADVVDLQWVESIRLVDRLRRLGPRARFVGTFHDVQSQLFSREPARRRGDAVYWRALARRSRRHERRLVAALDEVVVFSTKDAALLGDPPHARVVPPPMPAPSGRHRPPADPVVLVVSYLARDENDRAAQWLLREIWPLVRARTPGARLRLLGSGASADVVALAAGDDSVELAGFVADLDAAYAGAAVALVPLRQGAGVKFKTIEALLHGVPTVTTSVGAEGIEGPDLFAATVDDAPGLADAVGQVLADPDRWQERSDRAQDHARATWGDEAFAAAVRRTWQP